MFVSSIATVSQTLSLCKISNSSVSLISCSVGGWDNCIAETGAQCGKSGTPICMLLPSPVASIEMRPIAANEVTRMKNFGQIFLMALPNSSISNVLKSDGAMIAVWRIIMPTIAPGK